MFNPIFFSASFNHVTKCPVQGLSNLVFYCSPAWIKVFFSAAQVLLCPLHTQVPVAYLTPAPGIFRESFLPESSTCSSLPVTFPFSILEGFQIPLQLILAHGIIIRIQDGAQKCTATRYRWEETRARKVISSGTSSSSILLNYGSRIFPLKSFQLSKLYLTHTIQNFGSGNSLASSLLYSVCS